MLILMRRIGEAINIGNDISVRVLDIQDSQVRIGINAPRELPVHGGEIFHRIQQQNTSSLIDVDARFNV